jgi:ABC-type transporter Mla MlaB component
MGATVELRLSGPLTEDGVASTCELLRTRLGAGGVSRVVCHLDRVRSDLVAVDALARLVLTARRAGVSFDLRGHDPDLPALLRLVGLSGLLASAPAVDR